MRKLFVSAFALLSVSVLPAAHAAEVLDSPALSKIGPESNLEKKDEISSTESSQQKNDSGEKTNIPEKAKEISVEPLPLPGEDNQNDQKTEEETEKGVSKLPEAQGEKQEVLEKKSSSEEAGQNKDEEAAKQSDTTEKVDRAEKPTEAAEKAGDTVKTEPGVSEIPSDATKGDTQSGEKQKGLKLERVQSSDLFSSPNAFVSVLNPGYWHEIPTKVGNGWRGSLLVNPEILDCLIKKDANRLADILIREDAKPSLRNGVVQAIIAAINNISESDLETLHYIYVSEIMTFEDILRKNDLFDRYQSTIEDLGKRPHVGIIVNWLNGLNIDLSEVAKLYKTRIEMAKEIEKYRESIKEKLSERNKFISPSEQVKLKAIQKLVDEKAAVQKIVDDNKDIIADIEAKKRTLDSAKEELNKANAMPNRTAANKKARTNAINAAQQKVNKSQIDYDEQTKKLPNEYDEAKRRVDEVNAKIADLDNDPDFAAAKVMDKKYDKDIVEILAKIKECYMRLVYLDPSKISPVALKAMKLPQDLKNKVAELNPLLQRNKELQAIVDANRDAAAELELKKKALDDAKAELSNAQKKPTRNASQRKQRDMAVKAAQSKVEQAQAAYDAQSNKLPPEYESAKKEYGTNVERIKALSVPEVLEAKRILKSFEAEQQAAKDHSEQEQAQKSVPDQAQKPDQEQTAEENDVTAGKIQPEEKKPEPKAESTTVAG